MSFSYETQLMAIAIALYIFDSSLLLYANEGVLIAGPKGKWHAIQGSDEFMLMGRSLYVTNLLAPHQPAFRLVWMFDEPNEKAPSTEWPDWAGKLRSVAPFTIGAGAALYVLLPLGLFTRLGTPVVFAAVAALYLNIILALCWLYPQRSAIHLRGKQFAALVFECIACPPFAVNLVRRVSLAQTISEQFPVAAQRLLDADDWADVRTRCAPRIDDEIDAEPEGSQRAQALRAQRRRFQSSEIGV